MLLPGRLRIFALFLVAFAGRATSAALSFDASPNPNGTIDLRLTHAWEWGGGLFSGFDATLMNPLDAQSESGSYVATSGTAVEASADLLGYRKPGRTSLGLALNLLYSRSWIKEVGYVDLEDSRLFLVNDRDIGIILPRLKGELRTDLGPLSLEIVGEYSPWFPVSLNQTLGTSRGGPRTAASHRSESTGANAWSISGSASLRNPILSPEAEFSVDHVPIGYSYIDALQVIRSLDSLISESSLLLGFTLHALKLGGSSPRILGGWEWSVTTDLGSGAKIADQVRPRLKIGLGL